MNRKIRDNSCPCGSGDLYRDCCGQYIDQGHPAPSPEKLMRSRYTAYSLGNELYLVNTWHESTRPVRLDLDTDQPVKWTGLEILSAPAAGLDEGAVEFIARFKQNGKAGKMHERSRFVKHTGRWFYVDGTRD